MKHGMLVTGPNASGKTTATLAALSDWERDPRLRTVYADNSDRSAFKGTMDDMVNLLADIWLSDAGLVVVEGTNRIATVLGRVIARHPQERKWSAHVTRPLDASTMRAHIKARCALLGKRYREDYWVDRVLDYESQRRYANLMTAAFSAGPVKFYAIKSDYDGLIELRRDIWSIANEALGAPLVVSTEQPPPVEERPGRLF